MLFVSSTLEHSINRMILACHISPVPGYGRSPAQRSQKEEWGTKEGQEEGGKGERRQRGNTGRRGCFPRAWNQQAPLALQRHGAC